ncbi:hypothetical protein C487_16329 [Natrinema pallidum DSM 3751]|uniref:Uncharacterized protein n=1 Tax=Natrinema pallidum DSM 3751 TaxID=1227495 RepID=L9YMA1_9EURY|nr:hypothetical protein C487_16329 [Natrinema pallidum DSM 3751]
MCTADASEISDGVDATMGVRIEVEVVVHHRPIVDHTRQWVGEIRKCSDPARAALTSRSLSRERFDR